MKRALFPAMGGAALVFFLAAPVLAENVSHPKAALQTIRGHEEPAFENALAPRGSDGAPKGKSPVVAGSATAPANRVTLASDTVDWVFGAVNFKTTEAVNYNQVFINGGTVNKRVVGGIHQLANGDTGAEHNSVVIRGASVSSVVGGNAESRKTGHAAAIGNTVDAQAGTTDEGFVLLGGTATSGQGHATATGNAVVLRAGKGMAIVGGMVHSRGGNATANGNTVEILGGVVHGVQGLGVIGGYGENNGGGSMTADGNTVVVVDGSSTGSIVGGGAYQRDNGKASASNNVVDIRGGTIGGTVSGGDTGGEAGAAVAMNNTVRISGTPKFDRMLLLRGGVVNAAANEIEHPPAYNRAASNGNTLHMESAGLPVYELGWFQKLTFRLPATLKSGDTVLTVTKAYLDTNTEIEVTAPGLPVQTGDTFILIDASREGSALTGTVAAASLSGTLNGHAYTIEPSKTQLALKIGAPATPP